MSFCFTDPSLFPKIKSNAVAVDRYEVTNLISPYASVRNKGFLVESFIKPPINITIEFPVNIDIKQVVIGTTVGSQKSTGIELYSYSQKGRSTWLFDQVEGKNSVQCDDRSSHPMKVCNCLGRSFNTQKRFLCFTNPVYRERQFGRGFMPMQSMYYLDEDSAEFIEMRSKYPSHLNNVSYIIVRITRAFHGTTCALRCLEVMGQPSQYNPKPWITHMVQLCQKITKANVTENQDQGTRPVNLSSDQHTDQSIDTEIPEEFLDPLTQEMMMMPVLLPSGKTVDQSSLDRHVQEQSKWGHSPSDPFTWTEFSATSKPVPNTNLKTRMDQFLLKHPQIACKHDFRVGRSVIGSQTVVKPVTQSNLVKGHSSEKDNTFQIMLSSSCRKRKVSDEFNSALVKSTRVSNKDQEFEYSTFKKQQNSVSSCDNSNLTLSKNIDLSICEKTSNSSSGAMLSDLDATLKYTLSGLPSFLNKRTRMKSTTTQNKAKNPLPDTGDQNSNCQNCGSHTQISLLYKTVCDHLICRTCLIHPREGDRTVWCKTCNKYMNRSEVVKAHF